jgi:hypothetical protein
LKFKHKYDENKYLSYSILLTVTLAGALYITVYFDIYRKKNPLEKLFPLMLQRHRDTRDNIPPAM